MRQRLIFFLPLVCLAFEEKEASKPPPPPESILQRVWANRASTDLALKGRLFIERNRHMPVEVRIKNLADEVRTVYRGDKLELLVVQVPRRSTRFYLAGRGELTTPQQQMERVLGSWISYYDLGLPFLSWPNPKFLGEDRMRGQDCYVLEVKSDSAPYRRVKLWIHNEYFALLKAEAFDADDNPVKRITVTSFKRIGNVWIPRGMDFAFVPPGQSLPSSERSRLEIYEGNYDAMLPLAEFDPARFGVRPSAANN